MNKEEFLDMFLTSIVLSDRSNNYGFLVGNVEEFIFSLTRNFLVQDSIDNNFHFKTLTKGITDYGDVLFSIPQDPKILNARKEFTEYFNTHPSRQVFKNLKIEHLLNLNKLQDLQQLLKDNHLKIQDNSYQVLTSSIKSGLKLMEELSVVKNIVKQAMPMFLSERRENYNNWVKNTNLYKEPGFFSIPKFEDLRRHSQADTKYRDHPIYGEIIKSIEDREKVFINSLISDSNRKELIRLGNISTPISLLVYRYFITIDTMVCLNLDQAPSFIDTKLQQMMSSLMNH